MGTAVPTSTVRTKTTCPYCGVGCGVIAKRAKSGDVAIAGDPDHPANFGRLCSKGSALGETLGLQDRLLHPLIHGQRASWDQALDLTAKRFSEAIASHGPDSVAFYVSGQLLIEDYYVANKLMKGFMGSANIDTNSRLCMASSVAGHKRAFGADVVPGTYEDLELADLVVLVGSNLAWCHPVLFQRLATAREKRGTKIVVIDPRRTATCELADLHLALKPGSDVALFNGLLGELAARGNLDKRYIERHTLGLDAALKAAGPVDTAKLAQLTGLAADDIENFFGLFAKTPNTVTVYSQGVNQSSAGTDKVNAIINCHLATGRIGRPGQGPFSVTGQPNAMGGRETGGMANMLAAHMEIENPAHRDIVQTFWGAKSLPTAPGLKAVDMFKAVGDGRIKALWIMSTNPVDSMPDADHVRASLETCPFVVVSEVTAKTDTAQYAHVLLPAAAWGEKDGTVTNSERRTSRQRAFLKAPGEAKPDWWHMAQVGQRMGFAPAFDYAGPYEIFAEYARLTGSQNNGSRALDLSAYGAISARQYKAMVPFQWPAVAKLQARHADDPPTETRFFAVGGFYTADRRGKFIATPYRPTASTVSPAFPLLLNTGRIRDQWHTMTRSAKSARLMGSVPEPYLELHPNDARQLDLAHDQLVVVESVRAQVIVRANLSESQRRGEVFAPMHWTDQWASAARIDALVGPHVDPVSGQPELKATPVRVTPWAASWHGFAVVAQKPAGLDADYWALAPLRHGWRIDLAGLAEAVDLRVLAAQVLGETAGLDILDYEDQGVGDLRIAAFGGDELKAAIFLSRAPLQLAKAWLADQLVPGAFAGKPRSEILAGRSGEPAADRGPIVCACFEVGRNQIAALAERDGKSTVASVGAKLKAGTNCGSCRSEIAQIIATVALPKVA